MWFLAAYLICILKLKKKKKITNALSFLERRNRCFLLEQHHFSHKFLTIFNSRLHNFYFVKNTRGSIYLFIVHMVIIVQDTWSSIIWCAQCQCLLLRSVLELPYDLISLLKMWFKSSIYTFDLIILQAIKIFSDVRPPGIYKPEYIDALYAFYHEKKPEMIVCPPTPEWKRTPELVDLNGEAMPDDDDDGVPGSPLHVWVILKVNSNILAFIDISYYMNRLLNFCCVFMLVLFPISY